MITIYCALYIEAQHLIQYYELKKETDSIHFQVFSNERQGVRLVLTGAGMLNVAVAVAEISTLYPPQDGDWLVNFGSCAGGKEVSLESIIMVNKLTDVERARAFYPDMIWKHPFIEGEVETAARVHGKTVEKPISFGENEALPKAADVANQNIVVYDMEAAAIYEAGNFYYGPHQMMFLKVVTDHGIDGTGLDKELLAAIMERASGKVADFLDTLQKVPALDERMQGIQPEEQWQLLAQELCCSETMRIELYQLLTYWKLTKVDISDKLKYYYENGQLPCKEKRVGRRILNEWQHKWL